MWKTQEHTYAQIVLAHIGAWDGERDILLANFGMPKFAKPLVLIKYTHFTFKNTPSIFLEKQWTFTPKKSLGP